MDVDEETSSEYDEEQRTWTEIKERRKQASEEGNEARYYYLTELLHDYNRA